MEENKIVETTEEVKTVETPKKSKKGLVVTLILIIIALLGVLGYFAYDKLIAHKDNKESKETDKKDKKDDKKDDKKEESIKIDEEKDYVYDAEYDKGDAPESYGNETYTYYLKDIVVPFINIKTEGATKANEEIKSMFDELMAVYNEGASGGNGYVKYSEYKYYINGDILSIMFKTGTGATSVVHPYYHTYNFDLKTGEKISAHIGYQLSNMDSETIRTKVQEQIENIMKSTNYAFPESGEWSYAATLERSMQAYDDSISSGTIEFYFDENNKLNLQVVVSMGENPENNRQLITIE